MASSATCCYISACIDNNNNPSVLDTDLSQLDERKLALFKQNKETLAVLLQQFHKDSLLNPTDAAQRDLLLKTLNPSAELSSQLCSCVEVGTALFSIGVNFKVAQTLINNPDKFAELLSFAQNPEPSFQSS